MDTNNLTALLLIVLLDSNSFQVRESAQLSLEKMEYSIVPQLLLFDKKPISLEQSVRIRRLLNRQISKLIDIMCGNDTPFIDGIPRSGIEGFYKSDEYPGIVIHYRDLALNPCYTQRLNCEPIPYKDYRLATKLWLGYKLESGKSWDDLEKVLDRLRVRTKYYLLHNNQWPPED